MCYRRERKYFPVHKMTNRMSNTLRRIYKYNLQFEQDKAKATQEHKSDLPENAQEGTAKNELYVKLTSDLVVGQKILATPKMSPKTASHKKNRHRRVGSADSNYSFILPSIHMNDKRNQKMVHVETQTDSVNNAATNQTFSKYEDNDFNSQEEFIQDIQSPKEMQDLQQIFENQKKDTLSVNNGNMSVSSTICDNIAEQSLLPDEQSIYDYMNSNDQLENHETVCDEDNVEQLNRRVSQFFTQNGLLQSAENGNESIIDSRLLLSIMAARRGCITINDRDEVTVLRHSAPKMYASSRTESDPNCNHEDGDDSWTDEDVEEIYTKYSYLRRKRLVALITINYYLFLNITNKLNH